MGQFIQAPLPSQINPQTAAQPMSRGSGGFIVRNDFSASGMAPQIDRRAFVQAAASRGAIGEGIQSAGQQLDKIAQVRFHAVNQRRVLEARSVMEMAEGDLAKALANEKDTSKWEGIAQKHAESIKEMVMTKDLSPDAREAIDLQHIKWTGDVVRNAKVSAANRELQLLGEHHNANFIRAVDAGYFDGARQIVQDWQTSGTLAEDQAVSKLIQINDKQKQAASNNAFAALNDPARRDVEGAKAIIEAAPFTSDEKAAELARIDATHGVNQQRDEFQKLKIEDPAKAKLMLENGYFAKIPPGDRAAMMLEAEQFQAVYASDTFRNVKERIDLGQVKAGEKFDAPAFAQLTPHMKMELQGYLAKKEQKDALNDPAVYQKAFSLVTAYNPADDESGLKKAQLEATIETHFAGSYLETLKSKLEERAKGVKPDSVPLADAFSVLDDWAFKDKRFGEFESQKTDNAGRGIFARKKVESLQADGTLAEVEQLVPEKEIDPKKRDAVTSKVQSIKQQLEAEVKAGKIADRLQLMQRLSALTGQSVTSEAAGQVMPKATLFPTGQPSAIPDIKSILKKYAPNPGK